MHLKTAIYFGLLALIFSTLIFGLNLTSKSPYLTENSINESSIHTVSPNEDIKILNSQITKISDGKFIVTGQAQNTGHYKMRHVFITVNFYDKNGNILYSGFDGKSLINPDEIWDFTVLYENFTAPYSYKVKVE